MYRLIFNRRRLRRPHVGTVDLFTAFWLSPGRKLAAPPGESPPRSFFGLVSTVIATTAARPATTAIIGTQGVFRLVRSGRCAGLLEAEVAKLAKSSPVSVRPAGSPDDAGEGDCDGSAAAASRNAAS